MELGAERAPCHLSHEISTKQLPNWIKTFQEKNLHANSIQE